MSNEVMNLKRFLKPFDAEEYIVDKILGILVFFTCVL
jgi:hypothetical protein